MAKNMGANILGMRWVHWNLSNPMLMVNYMDLPNSTIEVGRLLAHIASCMAPATISGVMKGKMALLGSLRSSAYETVHYMDMNGGPKQINAPCGTNVTGIRVSFTASNECGT